MLLSRVAADLYWMGRYLERAENCNRQIHVTNNFAMELAGFESEKALEEWEFLAHCFPVDGVHNVKFNKEADVGLAYLNHFMLNTDNDVSVCSSVTRARECAKAVSESMTREVIVNINESYRLLSQRSGRPFRDKGQALDFNAETNRSLLTILGAVENTLTRDQGWWYHKLGEALERTRRTLIVLGARLPGLEELSEESSSPLHFAGWRSLLANLASLENYRHIYGPQFDSRNVVEFLVFNAGAPRSVLCGALRMQGYVDRLPRDTPGIANARREIGKLVATLQFDHEEVLSESALENFVPKTLATLTRIHEATINPDIEL